MRLLAVAYTVFALVTAHRTGPVLCPWRRLTGRRCPGCGLTRAVGAALAGDLRGSVRAHPLGVPAALVTVAVAGAGTLDGGTRRPVGPAGRGAG
jgi:Protein of unknown function (DUF2752)